MIEKRPNVGKNGWKRPKIAKHCHFFKNSAEKLKNSQEDSYSAQNSAPVQNFVGIPQNADNSASV